MGKSNVKVMYCPEHGLQFFDTKTETSEGNYPCEHAPHKENMMKYPEEIYATRDGGLLTSNQRKNAGAGWGRRHAHDIGFAAGLAKATDPLAGFSNLTAAIQAGEPIDWEHLDGLKVQCVHPDMGTLRGKLERNESRSADCSAGWCREGADGLYRSAFIYGWTGYGGWTLWLEGEVPLRRKTADQLDVGTYFLGKAWDDDPYLAYVGRPLTIDTVKTIYYAPEMLKAITPASEWEVIKEYGTFQNPEGE